MNWIKCTCLKQQEERGQDPIQALKMTTPLYMCYINSLTPDDKNFMPQHLKGLCGLAAEGIWQMKLLFEEEDLRRHNLEAADVSAFLDMNIFQKDSGCENCYSFIHLSFQEFFATMFYVMSPDEEGEESPDFSIPDFKNLLQEYREHDASFVVLVTHDAEFVTRALVNVQEMKLCSSCAYEVLIIAFCIKHWPGIQRLSSSCVSYVPDGIWQDIFSLVSMNQNLKELHLFPSRVEDVRMDNLFVGLRNPHCKLEELR
ncbi:NACHT, LRR and PYD domains-containing protein 12-like [Notamacropus eugenii]|uniref:NACHT, LRR and PYD domains-containing protein 12-like n=1 Tax=Notamacropus eugenii TaxID=9315 RepID=UPI003B6857BF